jgi:hypothetical protein
VGGSAALAAAAALASFALRDTSAAARAAACSRWDCSSAVAFLVVSSVMGGGVHDPVNGASVMSGCWSAWSGVHRSFGSAWSRPLRKSRSAARCVRSFAICSSVRPLANPTDWMISASLVCLKYFLPTGVFLPVFRSYSSRVISR